MTENWSKYIKNML